MRLRGCVFIKLQEDGIGSAHALRKAGVLKEQNQGGIKCSGALSVRRRGGQGGGASFDCAAFAALALCGIKCWVSKLQAASFWVWGLRVQGVVLFGVTGRQRI